MKVELSPRDRELLRAAIDTELHEQRNNLSNQTGMDDDECEDADRELAAIEAAYAKPRAKLPGTPGEG